MLALALTSRPAAAAVFVDDAIGGDLKPEQRVTVAHPQPVQLLFQFRTKGSPNAQGAKELKKDVVDTVNASGLFSNVSEEPAPNGAVLNVVIDDVVDPAEMKAATGQGMVTGLTLGLAGSTVREHYTCSIDYVGGPNAPKITRTATHFLLVQLGLFNGAPTGATKVPGGIKAGVAVMTRQIVSHPLNDLASDPAFSGGPAATAAAIPATPETTPGGTSATPSPASPAPATAPQPGV